MAITITRWESRSIHSRQACIERSGEPVRFAGRGQVIEEAAATTAAASGTFSTRSLGCCTLVTIDLTAPRGVKSCGLKPRCRRRTPADAWHHHPESRLNRPRVLWIGSHVKCTSFLDRRTKTTHRDIQRHPHAGDGPLPRGVPHATATSHRSDADRIHTERRPNPIRSARTPPPSS